MYPQEELNRLEGVKEVLRVRIARRRATVMREASHALRPLEWVDRGYQQWQRVAPFAKLASGPLGLLLFRTVSRRKGGVTGLLKWLPAAWTLVRNFRQFRSRPAS